jgi:hypothetical protein
MNVDPGRPSAQRRQGEPMTPDRLACIALVASLSTVSLALAHDAGESAEPAERLGVVHFEISCTPEAQRQFDRALAMLHSFWYPETVKAFTGVTQTDPDCAIAYWGLGLSHRPNPFAPPYATSLQRGWDVVQRGIALGTGTQREKDFLAAVEPYFKDFRPSTSGLARSPMRTPCGDCTRPTRQIRKRRCITRAASTRRL